LEVGGSERYKLTNREIPKHNLKYTLSRYDNENGSKYHVVDGDQDDLYQLNKSKDFYDEEASESHENMPPYIALLYCRKS
jgi:microcystin-dependent protein